MMMETTRNRTGCGVPLGIFLLCQIPLLGSFLGGPWVYSGPPR